MFCFTIVQKEMWELSEMWSALPHPHFHFIHRLYALFGIFLFFFLLPVPHCIVLCVFSTSFFPNIYIYIYFLFWFYRPSFFVPVLCVYYTVHDSLYVLFLFFPPSPSWEASRSLSSPFIIASWEKQRSLLVLSQGKHWYPTRRPSLLLPLAAVHITKRTM